jgi:hypothetical protein
MRTFVLDTSGIVKKLEASGFSRVQAEGITEVIKQLDISALATKQDLELALARQTTKLITWTSGSLLAQAAVIIAILQYLQ